MADRVLWKRSGTAVSNGELAKSEYRRDPTEGIGTWFRLAQA